MYLPAQALAANCENWVNGHNIAETDAVNLCKNFAIQHKFKKKYF